MSEFILRPGLWLLVCDTQKALVVKNDEVAGYPRLETQEVFKVDNPPTHEQGTAPPGRVFSSDGRRAATEETDFHQQAAQRFLAMVADNINRRVNQGQIRALAVIAPPKALGMLRSLLSERARQVVVAELERDYTKFPLEEIERSLAAQRAHD